MAMISTAFPRFKPVTSPQRSNIPQQRPASPAGDSFAFAGDHRPPESEDGLLGILFNFTPDGALSEAYPSPKANSLPDHNLPTVNPSLIAHKPKDLSPQEKIQSTLDKLDRVVVDNLFPLERQIVPSQFTALKLGNYIAQQDRFKDQLQQNPEVLHNGLAQLDSLIETLERDQPESLALQNQNAKVHRHLVNHILNRAVEQILENPAKANETCTRMVDAMSRAQQNAQHDPDLKNVESCLQSILQRAETQGQKLRVMQKALDLIRQGQLWPELLQPVPDEHSLVQKAQQHIAAIAKLPAGPVKNQALNDLKIKEAQLNKLLHQERNRQHSINGKPVVLRFRIAEEQG
jgi:hypothetical protein